MILRNLDDVPAATRKRLQVVLPNCGWFVFVPPPVPKTYLVFVLSSKYVVIVCVEPQIAIPLMNCGRVGSLTSKSDMPRQEATGVPLRVSTTVPVVPPVPFVTVRGVHVRGADQAAERQA